MAYKTTENQASTAIQVQIEQVVAKRALAQTLSQRAAIVPKNLQPVADVRVGQTDEDCYRACTRFTAEKRTRHDLDLYLEKHGVKEDTRTAVIRQGGILDIVHVSYWQSSVQIATVGYGKNTVEGRTVEARAYMTVAKEGAEKAGIGESQVLADCKNAVIAEAAKIGMSEQQAIQKYNQAILDDARDAGFSKAAIYQTAYGMGGSQLAEHYMHEAVQRQIEQYVALMITGKNLDKLINEIEERRDRLKPGKEKQDADRVATELGDITKDHNRTKFLERLKDDEEAQLALIFNLQRNLQQVARNNGAGAETAERVLQGIGAAFDGKTASLPSNPRAEAALAVGAAITAVYITTYKRVSMGG